MDEASRATIDREEIRHGLRHLILLVCWYVQCAEPEKHDRFAADIIRKAALQARRHRGWRLRDRLEARIARAADRIAAEFRVAVETNLEPWKKWASATLELELASIEPQPNEIESVFRQFLRRREKDEASKEGVVEPLLKAIQRVIGGKSVGAMRPLREEGRDGLPYEPVEDFSGEIQRMSELLESRPDSKRDARLIRETLLGQRPPSARPRIRARYIPIMERFEKLPSASTSGATALVGPSDPEQARKRRRPALRRKR